MQHEPVSRTDTSNCEIPLLSLLSPLLPLFAVLHFDLMLMLCVITNIHYCFSFLASLSSIGFLIVFSKGIVFLLFDHLLVNLPNDHEMTFMTVPETDLRKQICQ